MCEDETVSEGVTDCEREEEELRATSGEEIACEREDDEEERV